MKSMIKDIFQIKTEGEINELKVNMFTLNAEYVKLNSKVLDNKRSSAYNQ